MRLSGVAAMRQAVALLWFAIILVLSGPLFARTVDGLRANDLVLRSISDFLDAKGIDVRNGNSADQSSLLRPQLTELSNFPANPEIAGSAGPFSPTFSAGASSDRAYLVAVNHPGTAQPVALSEFKSTWDAAPAEKRIFISFSGKDLWAAEIVSQALRNSGYVVFIYKNNSTDLPPVNAVETGQFFRGAGHRYVIDTSNARSSPAVNAEALSLNTRRRTTPPIIPVAPNSTPTNEPCCRVCYYEDNILVRCDAPMCGEIACRGAR